MRSSRIPATKKKKKKRQICLHIINLSEYSALNVVFSMTTREFYKLDDTK